MKTIISLIFIQYLFLLILSIRLTFDMYIEKKKIKEENIKIVKENKKLKDDLIHYRNHKESYKPINNE